MIWDLVEQGPKQCTTGLQIIAVPLYPAVIWVPDQQGPKQVSTGIQITAVYDKLTWGPIKRGPKQCTTGFPITVSPSYSAVMWVPDQQGPKRVSAGAHIRAVYDELIWDSLGTCSELMSFPYTQSLAVARRQGALKKCAHDSPWSDSDRGASCTHFCRAPCLRATAND